MGVHYTISQLARAAETPTTTVRYYERIGLFEPADRSQNNYRLYSDESLRKLRFIRAAQAIGFTLDDVLESFDVVNMLRIQTERLAGALLPAGHEYARLFGLDAERAARLKPGALVMHPGPINRGVELTSEVADGPNSVILEQVTNGVFIRMAVLHLVTGGKPMKTD